MDPVQVASKITARTRALVPVHLFGQMVDMEAIMEVAAKHELIVIEDAAQAIGAEHKGGRAGSIGHYGCLSFFPSKNLGAAGDGGMVVTNDAQRAENLVRMRGHGAKPKYYHKVVGGNFRLDALQAAVVTAKLKYLDGWTLARQQNATRYDRLFQDSGLRVAYSSQYPSNGSSASHAADDRAPQIYLPKVVTDRHIFNQYIIRTTRRDQLKAALQEKGVSTEIYYPVPMHLQECFSSLGHEVGAFPESESAAKETLALPIYPELADEQARYVVKSVCDFSSTDAKAIFRLCVRINQNNCDWRCSQEHETEAIEEFFQLFKTPWELYRAGETYDVVLAAGKVGRGDGPIGSRLWLQQQRSIDRRTGSIQIAQPKAPLSAGVETRFRCMANSTFKPNGQPVICAQPPLRLRRWKSGRESRIIRLGYDLFDEIAFLLAAGRPVSNALVPLWICTSRCCATDAEQRSFLDRDTARGRARFRRC